VPEAAHVPFRFPDAEALAEQDPYQFQWWAFGLVDALPVEQEKGYPRRGIDGRIYFHDEVDSKAATKQVVISVKAGHVNVSQVRDRLGMLEGRTIELPSRHEVTFKKAQKLKGKRGNKNKNLVFDPAGDESPRADVD
jgi:hypothetical protein